MRTDVRVFDRLIADVDRNSILPAHQIFFSRVWSYGDVENNGVYYHPQLTHYAHQAFEEFFRANEGLHYVDLSRQTKESQKARQEHDPPIERMTFPVQWLHQWMLAPMHGGDVFNIGIDTVEVDDMCIGVRAWVHDNRQQLAALVIWLRWAKDLERNSTIKIPSWFPRQLKRLSTM